VSIEPYELPCGCWLRILDGGVVDESRCAEHHAATLSGLESVKPGEPVPAFLIRPDYEVVPEDVYDARMRRHREKSED
jgi:hypothetical protein